MKYTLIAPPSKTPQTLAFSIPDLPATVTPVITGTTPIDPTTPPTNQPPTANAGTDVTITLPTNTVLLSGRGTDPEGIAVSFKWSQVAGGAATILSPDSANTDAILPGAGLFSFRLTVTDDKGLTKTDDVNITLTSAPPPVTPSKYEGFGSQAIGGEGKQVISVASKSQFDNALGSNRIIRFTANVSFSGRYEITNTSYLTIDGNGFDVTIDNGNNGDGISIGQGSHHIVLTGIRVINAGNDCINVVDNAHDIVIDHCSAYGGRDGNIDIAATSGKNVSVQFCLIGSGQSGWSGDTLVTCQNVSIHHCLLAPAGSPGVQERCPFIHANYSPVGNPNCDFRNNVVVGWGRYASGIGYKATANFVNNYYGSNKSGAINLAADPASPSVAYVAGNVQLGGTNINGVSNHSEYPISDPYKITMTDAKTAAGVVKAQVGTAKKNSYETGVINSITIQ